jgi:hypothetical protein
VKVLCVENQEFANNLLIEFIGNVNSAFKNYVASDEQLNKVTRFVDQMPHSELLKLYGETDLQLLVLAHTAIAPGNLPGKFFEYLASGNPILAIGPSEGDAAQVLKETEAGKIVERESLEEIKISLANSFAKWPNKNSSGRSATYSRSNLTQQLIELLND